MGRRGWDELRNSHIAPCAGGGVFLGLVSNSIVSKNTMRAPALVSVCGNRAPFRERN